MKTEKYQPERVHETGSPNFVLSFCIITKRVLTSAQAQFLLDSCPEMYRYNKLFYTRTNNTNRTQIVVKCRTAAALAFCEQFKDSYIFESWVCHEELQLTK